MSVSIKHKFQCLVSDGADNTVVRPSNWNDEHDIAITPADIGAAVEGHTHSGLYAPALSADDNYLTDAEKSALHSHSNKIALDTVSGVNTGDQDLSGFLTASDLTGNYATLTDGKVPAAQLPSYVDDVVEAVNLAVLPITGEANKIYVTLDNNLCYRWSGSGYVEISASLAIGETSATAFRGDYGKTAYDHSQATGNPHGTTYSQVGAAAEAHTHTGVYDPAGSASTAVSGHTTAFDHSLLHAAHSDDQDLSGKEDSSNKVTSISAVSTDTQYPSAKLLYDQTNTRQPIFNGLNNPALFDVTYDHATRIFAVTYSAGAEVRVSGLIYLKSGSEQTAPHADASGKYYLYFNDSGVLTVSTATWNIEVTAQLRLVYHSKAKGASVIMLDAHPSDSGMSAASHKYNHLSHGTQLISGGVISGYTLLNGNVLSEIQYAVDSVTFVDEDIQHTSAAIPKLGSGTPAQTIRIYYRASDGTWTWDDTSISGLLDNGTNFYANVFTGGVWTLQAQTTNQRWVNYFLVAIPDSNQSYRVAAVMGQTVFTDQASAESEEPETGIAGWREFTSEHVFFVRFTYMRKNSANTKDAQLVAAQYIRSNNSSISGLAPSSHTALSDRTATGSHPALAISVVPAGNITAINSQAALEELDSKKAPATHIHATSDIIGFDVAALAAAPAETTTTIGEVINGSTAITSPDDTDTLAIRNHTGGLLHKLAWSNVKSVLKTYFDGIYQSAGSYLTNGGALGTPASGNLANCTFPTLNQNTTGTAGGLSGKPAIAVSSATFGANITNDTITSAAFTALESAGLANREQQKTLKQRFQSGQVTVMQSSGAKADQWTWSTVPFVAVTLPYKLDSSSYTVLTEVAAFTGSLGVVAVTEKSATGFKIQHNGNANSVVVNWIAVKLSL